MLTVTLKDVPTELYERLKRSAERHHRSIDGEAMICLERFLSSERVDSDELLLRARRLRSGIPNVFVTDAELRAAREAGRP